MSDKQKPEKKSNVITDVARIRYCCENLDQTLFFTKNDDKTELILDQSSDEFIRKAVCVIPAMPATSLGSASFKKEYATKYACYIGSMANAISSERMVVALGKKQMLASFGAAGLTKRRLEEAITIIQQALPNGPYAFNLIHSPYDGDLEKKHVELYIERGVNVVEASAYLKLTKHLIRYKVSGLERDQYGETIDNHKIIAKVSRMEVAQQFMQSANQKIVDELVMEGLINKEQANLSQLVAMANDITVEADSGGHTDNRPLLTILPQIIRLRKHFEKTLPFTKNIRIGAAGGIGCPEAAYAAFSMGADYIVTGSINQACHEAGTSAHTKKLLSDASVTDVMMAPAADMFEMGVKLQVLKRGTLFAMRAQKLYDLYKTYNSIEDIPSNIRGQIEKQIFQKNLDVVWQETMAFFNARDPNIIKKARNKPKKKMALIFRWYLGLSSYWATSGEKKRIMDYQIWMGPAMGAFNDWIKDTDLVDKANRGVVEINKLLMHETARLKRKEIMKVFKLEKYIL